MLKYSLLGYMGIGKTTLLKKLGHYPKNLVKWPFISKNLYIQIGDQKIGCRIQILDIPPSCSFSRPKGWLNFKLALGGILIIDGTNSVDINKTKLWIYEFFKHNDTGSCPIILLGNKYDLKTKKNWVLNKELVGSIKSSLKQEFANINIRYIETSGKTGYNIIKALEILSQEVLKLKNIENN